MLIMQIESEGTQARLERLAHIELGVRASNFQGPCNYGQFGPTVPEVKAKTGQEFYNAEFIFKDGRLKTYAVIEDSGKSFTINSLVNILVQLESTVLDFDLIILNSDKS